MRSLAVSPVATAALKLQYAKWFCVCARMSMEIEPPRIISFEHLHEPREREKKIVCILHKSRFPLSSLCVRLSLFLFISEHHEQLAKRYFCAHIDNRTNIAHTWCWRCDRQCCHCRCCCCCACHYIVHWRSRALPYNSNQFAWSAVNNDLSQCFI